MSVQPSAAQYEAVIVQTAITMLNRIGISGTQAQQMWNPEAEETPIPRTYMEGYSDGKAWALEKVQLTKEDVLAAGGIVHRDGNVFFTNLALLNKAIANKLEP